MNGADTETKEPLADGITDEQIEQLIAERKETGATHCEVVTEDGQRYLVCRWAPL